jgi:hypothetical protein
MKKPGIKHLTRLLAMGVLWMSMAGCSIQKRTTTHGFHIEKQSARVHVPVATVSAEIQGLPDHYRTSAPKRAEGLKRLTPKTIQPSEAVEVSRRCIFPVNGVLSPDSGAAGSKAPESRREKLKNSILAVLGRPNKLDTASQVVDVPLAQLEELREEARKASRWNFLLGLLHLPWSIIQGEDYLIFQGIGFLVLGWHIKRLARDDAKLLAWEERRQLERQRRQNRTWWQWLLIGLGVASLFVLLYGFVAFTYGFGVWIL